VKRLIRILSIIALAVALVCVMYITRPERRTKRIHEPPPQPAIARTAKSATPRPQVDPERPALRPLPASNDTPRSPLADKLNAPDGGGTRDVAIVLNLFTHYRERFGGVPTGEDNAAFVNALAGNNPQRLAFIDRGHPAINARGELLDRWGTPFVFHLESRDHIEVRSAGPDRELYTLDDLVSGSPNRATAERLSAAQ
jgi:hypothetical protein